MLQHNWFFHDFCQKENARAIVRWISTRYSSLPWLDKLGDLSFVAYNVLEHFHPSDTKHVVLLLDNHESHKYYPSLELASQNHIIFVSLHPFHRVQPLDVAVYGLIKRYFEQEINTFLKQHPGRIVG